MTELDSRILSHLPERQGLQKTVLDAIADAVEAGGKRVRPRLMEAAYRLFCRKTGREQEPALIDAFLTAMEMLHTGSLIHDDLPCMDNDTLRRGKPTTWVTYGVDMATLAGDALMLEPFVLMSRAALESRDPVRGLQAIEIFARKAGIAGMTGGQVVDVEQTGKPLTREQLLFIYRLKTGALLEASLMIGAILGGASPEEVTRMERIGSNIGMAFQIRDDILDETSTDEKLGKPVHSDAENNKTTYVTLYGMDAAAEAVERCSAEALALLEKTGGNTSEIRGIIEALITRET